MLEKLQILAYSDEKLTDQTGTYWIQINPEKYTQEYATKLHSNPTLNTGGVTNKFVVQQPQDLTLEVYLDATGMVPRVQGQTIVNKVSDEIDKFKAVVYSYNGTIHSPNYLRVLWGTLNFECRLLKMGIEYMLFSPSGVPLRAKLTLSFVQYLSPEKLQLKSKKSSPDLTHHRTVVAGDTLPLMCYRIYRDSKYYAEVARVNGLDDFRNLVPGRQIFFPPLGD
jgi:hypothetical protein